MSISTGKIDMNALRAAVRKVLAYKPPPKSEQDQPRAQHRTDEAPPAKERVDNTKSSVR